MQNLIFGMKIFKQKLDLNWKDFYYISLIALKIAINTHTIPFGDL